jgi:dipeptidyl aminopeptidase/acylaminoacyl peptidase
MAAISSIVTRCETRRGWYRRARPTAVWLGAMAVLRTATAQPLPPPDSLAPPDGPHALGVRDLWALDRVSDAQPSPDGASIVYVRKSYDVKSNKGRSSLWLVPTVGGAARRVTTAKANDSNPRWSPDGRSVAFLSDRNGSTQIWNLDLAGGEPRALTDLPVDVESFRWSPNGAALAFAAEVYPDCATLACTKERTQKLEGNGVLVRRYDHLLIRHWDTWDSGRCKHLFVVPAKGGMPVDIVRGANMDAPPPPFGGAETYDWSPDGATVAFTARTHNPSASWTTNLDLYLGAADGSGFRCITAANLAVDTAIKRHRYTASQRLDKFPFQFVHHGLD